MNTTPTAAPTTTVASRLPSVGWPVLIGVLLLRTVLLFAANLAMLPLFGSYDRTLMWPYVTLVLVDVISIVVIAMLLRRRGQTLADLISFRLRDTGWALLVTVILIVGFFVATFIGNLVAYLGPPPTPSWEGFSPPLWYALWTVLVAPITIALAEELLYRGWAQPELTARTNKVLAIGIMAFFFALQHAAFTPLDLQAQVARFVAMFLSGILFGVLYLWRKRLWPLIFAHWFLDVIGLGLPVLFAALA
ncbi:type II CAAX endopeptidase family protein [Ammonicoccus fulvus]|uniref:Type II CAAX endopeptidase family protein n=1 Tax=Ammonicoccus fulvus TaxID=3138240 RepID=A0ABZ3FT48_9ACTN